MACAKFISLAVVLLVVACGPASAQYGSPMLRRLLTEGGSPSLYRRLSETSSFRRLNEFGSPTPMRRLAEEVEEAFHYCMSTAELLSQRDDYSTFLSAVEVADLDDILSDSSNELLVFAPNNAAFDGFFETQGMAADDFLSDPDMVASFFKAHLTTETKTFSSFVLTETEEQPLLKCNTVLYSVDNVVMDTEGEEA